MAEKLQSETTSGFDSRAYPFGADIRLKRDVSKMKVNITVEIGRAERIEDGTILIDGELAFEKVDNACQCKVFFPEYPPDSPCSPQSSKRKAVQLSLCKYCLDKQESESSDEDEESGSDAEPEQRANDSDMEISRLDLPATGGPQRWSKEHVAQHVRAHRAHFTKTKYFVRTVEVIPRQGELPNKQGGFLSVGIPKRADVKDVLYSIRRLTMYLNKRMQAAGDPDLEEDLQLTPKDVLRDYEAIDDALREINTSFTEVEQRQIKRYFEMSRERNRRRLREGNASPTLPDNLVTDSGEETEETSVSDKKEKSERSQTQWRRQPIDWTSPQRSLRPNKN
jgi:hypothetical protein